MTGGFTFQTDPPPRRSRALWLALGGLVVAAVLGLLVGAVWGLRSRDTPPSAGPTHPVSPGPTPSTPTTPTTPSVPTSPTTPTPPTSPTPPPDGSFPPAPPSSQQTSHGWHVGPWRITNTGGVIGMEATVTNKLTATRSADLTVFLYVDGQPLAAVHATVSEVAGGAAIPVIFTSTDKWGPGTKTLLLVAS